MSNTIFAANIQKTVTGTDLGGGKVGLDISGTVSATNPSVGTNGATAPTSSTEVGTIDGSGNLQGVSPTNPLPVTGTVTANNPSVSATGSAVPADATMVGGSDGTNLKALKVSTAGVLSVDGSAVTQPISAASLPLPTGAATAAKQPALGTAGTASTDVLTVQGIASMTAIKVDGSAVTQPVSGTVTSKTQDGSGNAIGSTAGALNVNVSSGSVTATNSANGNTGSAVPAQATFIGANQGGNLVGASLDGSGNLNVNVNAALPAGTNTVGSINNISGTISLPTGAATSANQTTGNTSLATIATNSAKQPINTTGSGSGAAATVSTVITLSAPANAVGFILQCLDTSTANVRWSIGRTASATLGQQLQPGRDSGYVPCGASVSLCAESGTQNYDVQWISQ